MLAGENQEMATQKSNRRLKVQQLPSQVHLQITTLALRTNLKKEKERDYQTMMTVRHMDHLTNGANATKIDSAITSAQKDQAKCPISRQDIPST